MFDPREKLHPPLAEVSSVPCLRVWVRARVSRILERRFTPRLGAPRGASFFVLDPYFCAESRVCYTARVVRRRNGTLRVEGCRIWPTPATWVTGEPAETALNPLLPLAYRSLSLSPCEFVRASGNELLNRVQWPLHKYNASLRVIN